jgi:hypothetical protein
LGPVRWAATRPDSGVFSLLIPVSMTILISGLGAVLITVLTPVLISGVGVVDHFIWFGTRHFGKSLVLND